MTRIEDVREEGFCGLVCLPFGSFSGVGAVICAIGGAFSFWQVVTFILGLVLVAYALKTIYDFCWGMPMWAIVPLTILVGWLVYSNAEVARIIIASGAAYLAFVFLVLTCDALELY